MTRAGCPGIPATSAVSMDMIPKVDLTQNNGQKVCVQRSKGVTFVKTATNMKVDGTCSKGKPCGGTGQAKGAYTMCIETSTCPVTNIAIKAAYTNTSYTLSGETENGGVYITREGGNLPLAEVLSSVSSVCKNDNDQSYYGGGSNHPLLIDSKYVQFSCEGGTDPTFVKIVRYLFISKK